MVRAGATEFRWRHSEGVARNGGSRSRSARNQSGVCKLNLAPSIPPPPPPWPVSPVHYIWTAGSTLHRIYAPARCGATALGFRTAGPFVRFDHHEVGHRRGILYAAESLDGALVEVAGDRGICSYSSLRYTSFAPTRDLLLLDLTSAGVRQAGMLAKVTSCDHGDSQKWARYCYDNAGLYGEIDGFYYPNAHNFYIAVALFERAQNALPLHPAFDRKLGNAAHREELLAAGPSTNTLLIR
ncbi:MAG TPA: RES domain-containing protein [Candidatus Tumulicola sp.]